MTTSASPPGQQAVVPIPLLRRPDARIAALTVVLWLVAGVALVPLATMPSWADEHPWTGWTAPIALAAGFAITEVFVVHLRIRSDAHTFSLAELPLALGLFFVQPVVLVGAQLIGAGAALALHRRQPALKLLFNLGAFAVTTVAAITTLRLLTPDHRSVSPTTVAVGVVASLLAALLGVVLVFVAISISSQSWSPGDLRANLLFGAVTGSFTACLGGVLVVIADAQPASTWMLVVLAAGVYLANAAYAGERRRDEGIDFLHRSTNLLSRSTEIEDAVDALLRQACDTFGVALSELAVFGVGSTAAARTRVVDGRSAVAEQVTDADTSLLVEIATAGGHIVTADSRTAAPFAAATGHRDGLVAPLRWEGDTIGVLLIAHRRSTVVGFDASDLKLAETVATHMASALMNGQLEHSVQQLRTVEGHLTFQALHDPLTGLANRTLFRSSLVELAAGRDEQRSAVAFIDLDDFKSVNDRFGHAVGDVLLVEVAERLAGMIGASDLAARLGGDEFAVLLGAVGDEGAATAAGERILDALCRPMNVGGRRLRISASIGVAMIEPTIEPEELMRSADAAMYAAKAAGRRRVVLFDRDVTGDPGPRQARRRDLGRAMERGEMFLALRPIVDLASSAVVGAHARVRWVHPSHGPIGPRELAELAEEVGLAALIDIWLVQEAAAWLAGFDALRPGAVPMVCVALSPASLEEPHLVDHVVGALDRCGLGPRRLVLEVSEETLRSASPAAGRSLEQLRCAGLELVLADVGGDASIGVVSVPSFGAIRLAADLLGGASDENAAAIVGIVAAAHAHRKIVVADGIDSAEQHLAALRWGVDHGLGHHVATLVDPTSTPSLPWAATGTGGVGSPVGRPGRHLRATPRR